MNQVALNFEPPKYHTLVAPESMSTFFGMRQVSDFSEKVIHPHFETNKAIPVVLDFSSIEKWDIAGLLWLVLALDFYGKAGLLFQLKFPEPNNEMDEKTRDIFQKSGDYLRRWKFIDALKNIHHDPRELMVKDQRGYFQTTLKHYIPRTVTTPEGIDEVLISKNLLEIKNLSDFPTYGSGGVTYECIVKRINEFQAARIGDVLAARCKISKRDADLFSDHLLTEALLNVAEHPDASIGMIAISKQPYDKELILVIVDNGTPIPETISPSYYSAHGKENCNYIRSQLSDGAVGDIIHWATLRGTTRKDKLAKPDVGMGLYYIKNGSVKTFSGILRILSDQVRLTYKGTIEKPHEVEGLFHPWRGNLIRISIPIL